MPPILKFVSNTEHAYDMPRFMTLRCVLISAEIRNRKIRQSRSY
jgi:hypothetical protein